MEAIKVEFPSRQGQLLAGILDLPDEPRAFAIYAHCFTCGKDIPVAYRIAKYLAQHGIAVLRFDFSGIGDSEGEFSDTNFTTNIEDVLSSAEFLSDQYQAARLLVGHSLGGTAAIGAASSLPEVRAVATIASPNKPSHVMEHFEEAKSMLAEKDEVEIKIMGRPFVIRRAFIEDLESYDCERLVQNMDKPILVMHSPNDQVVTIAEATKIFSAARHPRSFISLDTIDHLLKSKDDTDYVAANILSWASRYIS